MRQTWKRLTASLLSLVLLCSLITIPAHAATSAVTLEFKNGQWNGTEYSVDVTLTGNGGDFSLYSGELYVSFNKDVLQYKGRTLGTIAQGTNDDGDPVSITVNNSSVADTNTNGCYTMVYSSSVNHTITSGQTLFTMTFTVKPGIESCTTELSFTAPSGKENIVGYWNNANTHYTVTSSAVQNVAVQGEAPTLDSVALSETAISHNGEVKTIKATARSAKGTDITGNVTWAVTPANQGVTNEGSVITINKNAQNGTYTVTATPDGTTVQGTAKTATFTVTRTPAVATTAKIYKDGTAVGSTDIIIIPVTGAAERTYTYTAKLFDQFDSEMSGSPTWIWNPAASATGVSHSNGVVTVVAGATKDVEHSLTVAFGDDVSATVKLTPKDIDITWPTVTIKQNPTYGDTWAQIVTLGSNGTANLNGTNIPGKFTVEGTTANSPAAGEQTYIIRFKSDNNQYNVTTTGTVTVAKRTLTVGAGTFKVTKEFNGKTDVPEGEVAVVSGELALNNVLPADQGKVTIKQPISRANLAFTSTAIGKNLAVTISNLALNDEATSNYQLDKTTYELRCGEIVKTIPKLEHFVVTSPENFTYDGTKAGTATCALADGITGMGTVTVMYAKQNGETWDAPSATAPVNAGTYKVVLRIAEGTGYSALDALDTGKQFTIAKAARTLTVSDLTLLPPDKLTATMEMELPDADKSADGAMEFVLSGADTAVSRKGRVFTAVGNGTVTVKVSIKETDNYLASTEQTATITAVAQPVLGISGVTGETGDVLTATLSGTTINVTGVASSATVVPKVKLILADGLTQEQSGNTLTVKKDDATLATYTITVKVTVKPDDMDISEAAPDLAGNTHVDQAEVQGAAASTADELFKDAKDLADKAAAEGKLDGLGEGYIVKVEVRLEIDEKNYTTNKSLKMEITPKYTVVAHKDGDPTNYYDVAPKPITIPDRAIKSPITIKVKLPDGFNPKYAKHTLSSGPVEYLKLAFEAISGGGRYAVWQQSSFSEVELIDTTGQEVKITYNKETGTEIVVHDEGAMTLPTDSKNGYTFGGWKITYLDGEEKKDVGTYSGTLTNDQLSGLIAAATAHGTLTAEPIFTPIRHSGGGGGGGTYVPAGSYPVNVKSSSHGSVSRSPSNAKKGDTVTLTVKPNTGYVLDTLTVKDKDGNSIRLREQETNVYTFTMPDSAVSVEATFKAAETGPVNPFRDVFNSAYYYDAVMWAVENGVTGGTTATTFSPNNACTRAQTVTFLWRAAGSPAPASRNNPFTDVAPGAYYYDAVLWAVEKGITTGVTATTFGPNATVNRGQVVTFLSRSAKAAPVNGANPFTDVPANAYYANAVLWAVENGITNGTTATTFSPAAPCTRGQIVTFLYRYFV